jgi:hypothetical protein
MRASRFVARAKIERVVFVLFSYCMRMSPWESSRTVTRRGSGSEQAKEKKYVANADTLPHQMRLGRTCLSECPSAIREYGVFVAEIVGTNAPFGRVLDDLSEPCEPAARFGTALRWDRKTNRFSVDNRRRGLAGGAIKALSAKDHSHSRSS